MTQKFFVAFCDADFDSCNADKLMQDRLNALKQQLQHHIDAKAIHCWDTIFLHLVKSKIVNGHLSVDVVPLIV